MQGLTNNLLVALMDSRKVDLTEDEESYLKEMTDFGVTLPELLSDIKLANPELSNTEQMKKAKEAVISLVEKGVASLCCLTPNNTSNKVYEVDDKTMMELSAIKQHIADIRSWEQYTDIADDSVTYELAPTKLGEQVLDELFNV